jgi:hypothetical protein
MDIGPSRRRFGLLLLAGAAAVAMLLFSGGLSAVLGEPPSSTGPAEPSVVLNGSYSCTISELIYYQPPAGDPLTFREMVDGISMTSTGSTPAPPLPKSPGGSQIIGPGGNLATPPLATGIGTGHGFNDGTIEDCIRFAESMAAAARTLGCATSDVRHRPRLFQTEGANLSFVCEGPVSAEVHTIGELSRAVLALKPQAN